MSVARNRITAVQFPQTLSQSDNPMEFVGQASPLGACNLLEVPGLGSLDVDDDEGEMVIGIRPKSSPLPRRKSSVSDEDSEPEPPACGSRRVSFADAKGLSLVHVKEFEMWEIPKLPGCELSDGDGNGTEDFYLSFLNFSLPLSDEELFIKVRDQKVVLENLELLPGTAILKGVVRVLNISFSKAVYVRTTLDTWSSHFDLLAEYMPGSSDGQMDSFSFKLTLVPPFGEQGTRVDLCLRYETPVGTFWANNNSGNYVLFCHQEMKEQREKPLRENLNKRSCLKSVSQNLTGGNSSAIEASSQGNILPAVSKHLEELNSVKDKRLSDERSATSEDDEQKSRAENRRNRGRRGQRRAARAALTRGHLAQREGGADGTERDEAKQATQESVRQSAAAPEACSNALGDVLNQTSQAHSDAEKSENNSLAAIRGGESATRVPDNPEHLNEQPASADINSISKSASKAEGSLKHNMIHEGPNNVEPDPDDIAFSLTSSESLASWNNFTSGSVVAPLHHQVFGMVESAALKDEDITQSYDQCETAEKRCNITARENVIGVQECLNVTLNNSPAEGEDECLSVRSDPETLQHPVKIIHSQHRCTRLYEVPSPVYRDTATHPHTGSMLNMESGNVQGPEESICSQGEAQEDNMTFELHSKVIAEAQAELTEPKCSQIKTDLDAQTKRQKAMTSGAVDDIVDKNDFATRETSLETRVESHDAVEENKLENYVFEDEIIHPADTEVAAEVTGSMTKADHTRGDTFVSFKAKPIIVSEETQQCKMKASVATLERFSPAEPAEAKNWETTCMVEEKEENILTDEEQAKTTGVKCEDAETLAKDEVGQLQNTGTQTGLENKDAKQSKKAQMGGEATEREAEDADVLEDKQKSEEEERREFMAKTDRNVDKVQFTQKATIMGENEPAEGCVTRKREDKRTNVQNKEETEPEKLTEIELRGEAQADAAWDDRVKPKDNNIEDNRLDYVDEMLVGAGEGGTVEADPQGVTSGSTDDGAGRFEERQVITQNEVQGGSSVNNTQGKDKENPGGGQRAHVVTKTHEDGGDSASAESDSDDEVELYMRCLRAVHAGTPAHGDRDGGKRPQAGKSKSLSTHMPSISEALDEEQHLGCLLGKDEDAEELDVQPGATALSGGQEHANNHVSCWRETFSCSNISKTLLYATSLVVFLVVAYHYDFLACFALYLASVVWLCCQGDARTTRG